jgi:hypothetical protein
MRRGWLVVVGVIVVAATAGALTTGSSSADAAAWSGPSAALGQAAAAPPTARVGAFFFDGWSGTLGNFHWGGLLGTQFSVRRPLSGWTDDRQEAIVAQLRWAKAAGISFFLFDWHHNPDPGNGPINMAFDTYWKLPDTAGVDMAIAYVNQGPFAVPASEWSQVVENWASKYFVRPSYARVDGRPLLMILDEAGFIRQWGGAAGANSAIATLRAAARARGLPGVFVVGGRYLDWHSEQCYPHCVDTDSAFSAMHYDAIAEYTYPMIVEPRDGPRPYADAVAGYKRLWEVSAARGPFRHIPSIMAGFDARPMILAGQIQPREQGGWPLLNGHQSWFTRSPGDVGSFLSEAISWVESHPSMRVEAAPAPPLVLIQSWNELQEGAYILPTDGEGYGYLQAIAKAAGVQWQPPPKRTVRIMSATAATVTSTPAGIRCPPTCAGTFDEGTEVTLAAAPREGFILESWNGCTSSGSTCSLVLVGDRSVGITLGRAGQRRTVTLAVGARRIGRGRLVVLDGFTLCAKEEPVQLQRRVGSRWKSVITTHTTASGSYSIVLPKRAGTYRAFVPANSFGGRNCSAAASRAVAIPG